MLRIPSTVTVAAVVVAVLAVSAPSAAAAIKQSDKVWLGNNAEVWLEWNTAHKRMAAKLSTPEILFASWRGEVRAVVQRYVTPSLNKNMADTGRFHPQSMPVSTSGVTYTRGQWYRACGWVWISYYAGPECTPWILF